MTLTCTENGTWGTSTRKSGIWHISWFWSSGIKYYKHRPSGETFQDYWANDDPRDSGVGSALLFIDFVFENFRIFFENFRNFLKISEPEPEPEFEPELGKAIFCAVERLGSLAFPWFRSYGSVPMVRFLYLISTLDHTETEKSAEPIQTTSLSYLSVAIAAG